MKKAPPEKKQKAEEPKAPQPITRMLLDPSVPLRMRHEMLRGVVSSEDPQATLALGELIEAAAGGGDGGESLYADKLKAMRGRLDTWMVETDDKGREIQIPRLD